MPLRPEDHDFLRFRDEGSTEALGRVFDALAPRLLLLAGHVTRDAAQAEDLVQTTFLHALRDAERYDGRRPVQAWLAGILRHRALELLRRGALHPAVPLDERDRIGGDPAELAADREGFEQIVRAVEELEAPYREVLVLRVVHGLAPTEIAHALGRSPGTVRMQCRRGLERLKRLLPRSVLVAALALEPERGLASIRAALLASAERSTLLASAGRSAPALAATVLGGIVTVKVLATAGVLALALLFVALRPDRPSPPAVGAPASPAADMLPGADPVALEAPTTRRTVTTTAPTAAAGPGEDAPPLADLRVLVRLAEGAEPAPGVAVHVRPASGASAAGRELVTDPQGSATFPGLAPEPHLVLVDRLEEELSVDPRERGTLEILLPAGSDVQGRVVDLEGRGVADARVLAFHLLHPDRLLATRLTDAEGRFELRDWNPRTPLLARAAGFQPSELTAPRGRNGGEVVLRLGARGHRLKGRVLDASGAPAALAWIGIAVDEDAREALEGSSAVPGARVGKNLDREGFFLRADAEGAFESDEVPAGHVLVIARPAGPDSDEVGWEGLWIQREEHEITVRLRPGAEVRGAVQDGEGRARAGLVVEAEWEGTPALGQLEDELGALICDRTATTAADGSFALRGLLPGDYDLRVQGPRGELARDERVLPEAGVTRWDPVIAAGGSIHVRVLDPDGRAVAGWLVAASEREDSAGRGELLGDSTDSEGRAELRDLDLRREWQIHLYPAASAELLPHYIPTAKRGWVRPGPPELVVRLAPDELPAGSIRGQWTDPAGASRSAAVLELEREGWNERARTVTGEDGSFAFSSLPAGRYAVLAADSRYSRSRLAELDLGAGARIDLGPLAPRD